MSFQPVVPLGGNAGWAFLQRTEAAQRAAFERSPVIARDTTYFQANIAAVSTAEDLVGDYRLLKVALGAFGLDGDLPNKAFIQKILEGGTLDPDSLANRLADKRYLELARTFGFDLGTPSTKLSTFPAEIIALYQDRQFEAAVGAQDPGMRLAMGLERDLTDIAGGSDSEAAKWFTLMGTPPLRAVFETAFGLPQSLGSIDIDQQHEVFRSKAEAVFGDGSVSQFAESERREELIRRFLALGSIRESGFGPKSSASAALALLQAAAPLAPPAR